MDINELANEIAEWADTIIPDRTSQMAVQKLTMEEVPELLVVLNKTGKIDPLEIADVLILALDICVLEGVSPVDAILQKMEINRKRTWKINPNGVMNHVQDNGA